jgi:uncharacterized FlaG/YvyC family protein
MAQISVSPVEALAVSTSANPQPASPTPETRALNRSVSAAVQTLNDAGYAGQGREVTFSVDPATKRPVVKVLDTTTKEVLYQWPQEYVLQLAAETNKLSRDSG